MAQDNYKIVALDIDGTVLDSSGRMPDYFSTLIKVLEDFGVRVVFCTGRRWKTAHEVVSQLNYTHPIIICSGGAVIKDYGDGETVKALPLEKKSARKAVEEFPKRGLVPFVLPDAKLDEPDLIIPEDNKAQAENMLYVQRNRHSVRFSAPFECLITSPQSVLEIYTVDEKNKIIEAAKDLDAAFKDIAGITALNQPSYGPTYWALEVHGLQTSKWHAIEVLLQEWEVGKDQVVAIGDDVNDIPMLRDAGLSFAMANAVPETKAAADHITDSNDADGVLKALQWVFPWLSRLR